MSLVNYQRSANTRHRSACQVENVLSFLGNERLFIMRTPGMALGEELAELESMNLVDSRVRLYEINPDVFARQTKLWPNSGIRYGNALNVLRKLQGAGDTQGIWIDLDWTMAASTLTLDENWSRFVASTMNLFTFRERIAFSITFSGRDPDGIEWKQLSLKRIQTYLSTRPGYEIEFFDEPHTKNADPGCRPKAPGTDYSLPVGGAPMIHLNYFYTHLLTRRPNG